MRKSTLSKVAVIALLGLALHGCKKPSNGIDNNSVVTKPYFLFVCDTNGIVHHTNGDEFNDNPSDILFKHLDFTADGTPIRAITTAGENLIMIKQNAHVRIGRDRNFNPIWTENKVNPTAFYQSQILDVPSFKRIYFAANTGNGVYFSDTNGARSTWINDPAAVLPASPVTSYTQLENGTLVAFADGDRGNIYKKSAVDAPWSATPSTGLPTGGQFFLSHLQNWIVAADYTGGNGVYYSSDGGTSFQAIAGFPAGLNVFSLCPTFEQAILIGTDQQGVYRYTITGGLTASNTGIGPHAKVRGLAQKENYYKKGQVKQYIYAATNVGLYRSQDLGLNWVQITSTTLQATNFTAIY